MDRPTEIMEAIIARHGFVSLEHVGVNGERGYDGGPLLYRPWSLLPRAYVILPDYPSGIEFDDIIW